MSVGKPFDQYDLIAEPLASNDTFLMDNKSAVADEDRIVQVPIEDVSTAVGIPATTAASDFQVGNGSGAWIKKTLAETRGIIRVANSNIAPTTANVTAAVNTRYFADVSGLTANRNFVLPAGAIGDIIELDIKVGDDAFQLVIIGDTGISINVGSAATAWRKLWLAGDTLQLVMDTASNWQVVVDGRVPKRPMTVAQSATPAVEVDNGNIFITTGLAQAITGITVTGTPYDGQMFEQRITDDGTARAITPGASFLGTAEFPLAGLTTTISKTLKLLWEYSSALSAYQLVGKLNQA